MTAWACNVGFAVTGDGRDMSHAAEPKHRMGGSAEFGAQSDLCLEARAHASGTTLNQLKVGPGT